MIILDYSNWHENMRTASFHLLNYNGSLWSSSGEKERYSQVVDAKPDHYEINRFKILLGSACEYLTKSACLSRKVSILAQPKIPKSTSGPFGSVLTSVRSNLWLEQEFRSFGIRTPNDINTISFGTALSRLRDSVSTDPAALVTLDAIDLWREMHRNTDAHVSLKITFRSEYDNFLPHFNSLLELVRD